MSQLDAQAQAVVDELETLGGRPFEELTAAEAREQPTTADAAYALARRLGRDVEPEVVGSVEDRTLPGPGGPLPVRVYRPRETIGSARALPLLVFAHGGAWVLGDLDSADAMARALCNQARCVLVSVGYRLAPEHRFPAAHEDLLAATRWVTAHAGELDGDPARVAIAGESAGATLATATCLALRDAGERGPLLQALIVPVTDLAAVADDMAWYTNHLLSDPAEAADPRLSPLRLAIEQLAGLPPAIVVTRRCRRPARAGGGLRAGADGRRCADHSDPLPWRDARLLRPEGGARRRQSSGAGGGRGGPRRLREGLSRRCGHRDGAPSARRCDGGERALSPLAAANGPLPTRGRPAA